MTDPRQELCDAKASLHRAVEAGEVTEADEAAILALVAAYDEQDMTATLPTDGEYATDGGTESADAASHDTTRADATGSTGTDVGNPDAPTPDPTWDEVATLYESQTAGSTTQAGALAATILCDRHDFVTVRESDGVYHYHPDHGFYVRKGMTFVDELVERHLPGHMNPSRLRIIRQKVRARNYVDAADFTPPEGKVNVKNGVIDLERWAKDPHDALELHSPDYYFTACLDAVYDPDADANGLLQDALETAIPDPAERQKVLE